MSYPGQHLQRCWHLFDATGQTTGRLALQVANILRGKHKPTFLPNKDMGDYVVIVNAEKVQLTGNKWQKKLYRWHTGYPGGLKERPAAQMLQRNPTEVLRKAVLGMLKRNKLRMGCMERRLKVYVGPDHPHAAQLPSRVEPWPRVPPAKNGTFHFGLGRGAYAAPHSYQRGVVDVREKEERISSA